MSKEKVSGAATVLRRSSLHSYRLLFLSVVMVVSTLCVMAQNANDIGTPAESKPGQSTASTYAMDKIETVNLANGNMSLHIPLVTIGGRGSASYTIALSYNSKLWSPEHETELIPQGERDSGIPPEKVEHYRATFDDFAMREPNMISLGSGWTVLPYPALKTLRINIDPILDQTCSQHFNEDGPSCGYRYVLTKMWLLLPDGSEIELRDNLTDGAPARTVADAYGYHAAIDRDRGRVWHSTDGSNITCVSDPANASSWVFFPDGTRFQAISGSMKIIDRNGNFVSIAANTPSTGSTTYTDQLGRQTILASNGTTLTVTVKGYNGISDRTMTVDTAAIGALDGSGVPANLRADFRSLQRPFYSGDYLRTYSQGDIVHGDTNPHTDLFTGSENPDPIDLHSAVTTLHLLDGRSFRFRYNQYGEVAEIVYPGGGVSQIDYAGVGTLLCEAVPFDLAHQLNRQVVQRRSLSDGVNVDAVWTYGWGFGYVDGVQYPSMTVQARQGSVTGTLLASETHYFLMRDAEYNYCTGPNPPNGTGYEKWQNAKEFRVERQTGSSTVIEKRTWEQRAPVVWANDVGLSYNWYVVYGHGQEQPPNDPHLTNEDTILENGKTRRVTYTYDDFNNITSQNEYDFGGTDGSLGALVRQTFRTYATALNGVCYSNLNPSDSSCGAGLASDVSSIIHQRGVLLNETIKDAANNPEAYSEFEYDDYASDGNHAAIVANTGMIQYDGTQFSLFSSTTQPRGNITKAARWAGGSSYISSYSQYDNAGHVIWTKDPKGNVTTVSYADNFGDGSNPDSGSAGANGATFALATLATNALNHQARSQFDYTRGVQTGIKDANGIISKTEYDLIGRPVRGTAALGLSEQTIAETTYPTATSNVATMSKQLDTTRWLASKTELDGFDRVITSWQAEDGQHASSASYTICANTIYDALGRIKQVSNPYRPGQGESAVYTTTAYDLAGRVTSVTTPDNAVVTSSYNGNEVTVTDQAGKQRKSITDGLGRLKEVYEDPNGLNYLTSYSYDVLDDLITVSQGSQTRTFVYDSLKRLTSATNPEMCNQQGVPIPVTYLYDDNGNLISKTDARGVVSSYAYDALNRNTSITYTNDPANTPAITHTYDLATNGKGRLYQSQTSGASGSLKTIDSYDAMGRPPSERQQFYASSAWSQSYTTQRSYNLAGGVISQIDPSGHAVAYTYDNAGRTTGFTGNLGDGTQRTYATGITYASAGQMAQEQFGTTTPIYNKLSYNSRQQLSEIRASTTANDDSWNRGKILNQYSLQCSGAACNATDNNGNLRKQEVYIPNNEQNTSSTSWYQQYDYDSLNRLQRAHEYTGNTQLDWQQEYVYDPYGNRTIHQTNTWGTGINKKDFAVNTANNRLGVPGGQSGTMTYDSAGNLMTDTYSGSGVTRAYDAENRMTSETQASNYLAGSYTYNADGQRVRRKVGNVETWQVYGFDGELLAEYAANGMPASPQKEYGYQNGQLLVTATISAGWGSPPTLHDNPLVVAETTVQARHITELRDGINALRIHLGMSAASWAQSVVTGDVIKADHISEMRTRLDEALGPPPSPGYSGGLATSLPIKAIHIQELRDRVLAAWSSGSSTQVNWMVTDQLGTPRMIFDQTGSFANMKRHDYLPFGEELFGGPPNQPGSGGRITTQGYAADSVRQKFTQKERDNETGLDYFLARYYSSTQGRFTSPDPLYVELRRLVDPQQLNIYSYTRNNPLRFTDPDGLDIKLNCDDKNRCTEAVQDINNRKGHQFKVELKDGKLKVVGKVDQKKLSTGEKALFKAISDRNNTATINVIGNTGQSDFGNHDSRGVNTIDLENLSKLDAPSNKGGLNSGDALAHEVMDAYLSLSMEEGAADRAAADLYPALLLPNERNNKNDWGRGNTELRGSTFLQGITDGRGSERVTIRYITPIPAADLDSRWNSKDRIRENTHDAGSRVTGVEYVPKKP